MLLFLPVILVCFVCAVQICVPKFKACAGQDISETDAKDHVLIAGSKTYSVHDNHSDDPALTDVYTTLTEKVGILPFGHVLWKSISYRC